MTGDPAGCQCPPHWLGAVPPFCPVHNPMTYQTATGTACAPVGYSNWSSGAGWLTGGQRICDADIERIAKRVAELLKEQP